MIFIILKSHINIRILTKFCEEKAPIGVEKGQKNFGSKSVFFFKRIKEANFLGLLTY